MFIQQCWEVHGDRFDYSKAKFRGTTEPIIVGCPVHGDFEQIARKHRQGGCPLCGIEQAGKSRRKNKAAVFEETARSIHGDRYDYSQSKYTRAKEKVTIICPDHGPFEQEASGHLMGSGCMQCAIDNRIGPYGLTRAVRGDFDAESPTFLYLVIAKSPESGELVYKVGVGTPSRVVEVRGDMRRTGFEILDSTRTLYQSKGEAVIIEQLLHRQLAKYQCQVTESRRFAGYTELFEKKPDFVAVESSDILIRFREGDRWNIHDQYVE